VGSSKDENQSIHSMTKHPSSLGGQVQSHHDRFSVCECFWTAVFQDYKTAADGTYAILLLVYLDRADGNRVGVCI
jgi:hypothetical protein